MDLHVSYTHWGSRELEHLKIETRLHVIDESFEGR
jgi:hypothetical protein